MHSNRVNRELRETRIELSESQRRRLSRYSYAEEKNIYEDPDFMTKSTAYAPFEYDEIGDQACYQEAMQSRSQPIYLHISSVEEN